SSGAYATTRVERYLQESLPVVTHENTLEFVIGAFALRIDDDLAYSRIVRGVQFTSALIRMLRRFVRQPDVATPDGELAPLIEEIQTLLANPRISGVPDREIGGLGTLKVLRIDQTFRLHEKPTITRLLQLMYELDALVALADVTRKHGFVLPR